MATTLTTGLVRMSYLKVLKPERKSKDDPKLVFSGAFLVPKSDKATIAAIEEAIEEAIENGVAKTYEGKRPNTKSSAFKTPFRDGDEDRPDDPVYAGHMFFNANCSEDRRPFVVDKNVEAIIDASEVYSGIYGKVNVNFYPFNFEGKKGVAVSLNGIQKIKDGEALSGATPMDATEAFVKEDPKKYLNSIM